MAGKNREDIIRRLRTIKGHIGGIERMIASGKTCEEILVQMAAIKASLNRVTESILDEYAENCILEAVTEEEARQKIGSMVETILRFTR